MQTQLSHTSAIRPTKERHWSIYVTVVLLVAVVAGIVALASRGDGLDVIRNSTATFKDVGAATSAGYERFVDVDGIACIDMPRQGAMGVHYVNSALVGDGEIDVEHPEAMVYEPGDGAKPTLVGVEYVVLRAAWDAQHADPPELFETQFDVTASPNRFGLPDFYSLHVWAWRDNPAGLFAMWNPQVTCQSDRSD